MGAISGACARLVALCVLSALLEPIAEGTKSWAGVRLIASLLISLSMVDLVASVTGLL